LILLVPELSFMTGCSELKGSRVLKDVMREMLQSPRQHYERLTSLLRQIRGNPEASWELTSWGLVLDSDICRTQGRVLPTERINLQSISIVPGQDLNWSREVTRGVPISVIPLSHWLLVYPRHLQALVKDLVAALQSACVPMGMQLSQPSVLELKDDRIDTFIRSIQTMLGKEDKLQLVLCVISSSRDELYRAIKKLCCVHFPVPSQVINAHTVMGQPGKLKSVAQKVLLQINCKLGGELWGVDIPL
ncbi:PIWL2 protein, partial [Urocolius indicus]|nr:PIWL2 protein [Urocolius indicus]